MQVRDVPCPSVVGRASSCPQSKQRVPDGNAMLRLSSRRSNGPSKVLADRPPTRLFLPADSVKRPRPSYEAGVRHVVFQVFSYLGKMLRIPSSQRYSICSIKHHCLVLQGESISVVSESHLHSCTHNARAYRASWSRKASDAEEVELSPVLQECL